jgi:hypothetical protein
MLLQGVLYLLLIYVLDVCNVRFDAVITIWLRGRRRLYSFSLILFLIISRCISSWHRISILIPISTWWLLISNIFHLNLPWLWTLRWTHFLLYINLLRHLSLNCLWSYIDSLFWCWLINNWLVFAGLLSSSSTNIEILFWFSKFSLHWFVE